MNINFQFLGYKLTNKFLALVKFLFHTLRKAQIVHMLHSSQSTSCAHLILLNAFCAHVLLVNFPCLYAFTK
jgi:hypothetical protein